MTAMRLLVTGAAGMLGTDVVAAAAAQHDVVAFTRADLDITDAEAVRAAVRDTRPDAVINCAAYTNVDAAETDEDAATRINGDGAGHLAAAAAEQRRPHRPRLHGLRLPGRRDRALPRGRAHRPDRRLRPLQARRRDRGRERRADRPQHRPHGVGLRPARQELRRHDAPPRRRPRRGHGRRRPARLPDLHRPPRAGADHDRRAAAERRPARRRRRRVHVARPRRRDLRGRRPERHRRTAAPPPTSAPPRRVPPTLSSARPAPTHPPCRRGRTASMPT